MATIKSYTDLEQSKKLAEILPLDSADMFLAINGTIPVMAKYIDDGLVTADDTAIPCWSLAALLELLPKRIEIAENVYELSAYLYGIYYWNINNGNLCFEPNDKDNLVDACYDMIIRLNELNLL